MVEGVLKKQREVRSHCLPGFEHINRYWDNVHDVDAAKILPGEYYVTQDNELVSTVLGSCVSACIRDVQYGVGGMNHFPLHNYHNVLIRYLRRLSWHFYPLAT